MWWMALIGAAAGQASYLYDSYRNQREIGRQRAAAQQGYQYSQEHSDASFNLMRREALDSLGTQRNRLAQAFDADTAGFNLGLEGQALQNHAARVSLSDSGGLALAAQGAGGTRGSGGLQRQIDFQEAQFSRQADLQDRGNSLFMQNMARQYSNEFADIGREIDSWGQGGYRYEAKQLSDRYAAQMNALEQGEYEHSYQDAGFNWLDFLFAGLGGAGQGAAFGSQADNYRDQNNRNRR